MITINLSKNWQSLVVFIPAILASLVTYGYKLASGNIYNQIPAIIALLNPELYNQDFYIQEMTQFTPRYYYYHLITLPVQWGISLPLVCFFYYVFAFASFWLGLYCLGYFWQKSKLTAAIFTFLGFAATVNGRIGHADLFRTDPIPATLAMGLAIWGFYYCFRQRWVLGYLFFGITSLLQFLVGVLPGILMVAPLILTAKKNKNWRIAAFSLLALASCAALVYLPMLLTGNTSSEAISNQEFVYLYANIRHPHHLIFSAFGLTGSRGWLNFSLFSLGGILCISQTKCLSKNHQINFIAIIITSIFLLLINYFFVEIFPVATIAKLQFARVTPFAQLVILLTISLLFTKEYEQGNSSFAFLLVIAPILRGAGILLFILGISLWLRQWIQRKQEKYIDWSITLLALITGVFGLITYQRYAVLLVSILTLLIVTICSYQQIINFRAIISSFWWQAICGIILFLTFAIKFFPDGIVVDLFLLLWWYQSKQQTLKNSKHTTKIAIFLFVLLMVIYNHYDLLLLGASAFPLWLDQLFSHNRFKPLIASTLALGFGLFFTLGLVKALPSNLLKFWQKRFKIAAAADTEVATLAVRFQQFSPKDAVVLVPPLDEQFRFYARRGVVFSFKSFPFTDQGILEWKNRLLAIAGAVDIHKLALDQKYAQLSNKELVQVAKKYDADYILTHVDWHPSVEGVLVDQEQGWMIWQIN